MPIYPGPGAGGGGSGDVTADPAITNWDAATDGQALLSNGDGTATFETISAGSSILTPDGLTSITRSTRFNVKDYGASGIGRKYYAKWTTSVGTTTVSTRDSADSAKVHLLRVGNGVALIGAGPACSVSTPPVTGVNAAVTLVGAAITFTITDDANDIITSSAVMPAVTADPVRVSNSGGALPTGLAAATTYYVRKLTTAGTTWTFHPTANDATNNTNKIAITGGSGTHTIVGYTEHNHTFVAFDGNGGYTAASSAVQSFGWNLPAGWTAHYRTVTGPIPYGAAAMAIFGRGTSSRQCLVHLDVVTPFGSGTTDYWPASFTGITDLGAGSCRLDGVDSTHGIAVNDYVNIKATSTGDTWADGRFLVTAVGATTITFSGATFGSTATGKVRRGTFAWNDQGDLPPLHATKYLPDVENPVLKWRASCRVWQGQRMYDTVGARWWRAERVVGTALTGTVEPTWTALETTKFVDGQVTWVRDWLDSPVNEPSASVNQTLLTKVATVPTSSTFTTVNAATQDNATNGLLCSHNDALASRECLAAAKTYGQPATIEYPAGEYIHILPKQTNTTYWNDTETAYTVDDHFLLLNAGRDLAMPSISIVADPNANIRVRMMQTGRLIEDLGGDATNQRHVGNNTFITVGTDNTLVKGGMWEWGPAQCGFTEKDFLSISYGQTGNWLGYMQLGDSAVLGTRPERVTWDGVEVHWPTIATGLSGITAEDGSGLRTSKLSMLNCKLYYGGGDGDQTFLPWGDFVFQGGWVENDRRYGSHGFYLGVLNGNYRIQNCVIKGTGKNSIQARGSGGDSWIQNIDIANVSFVNSGPVLIGDTTASNRVHKATISNCNGNVFIRFAEVREASVIGGTYGTITALEDCKNLKLIGLVADTIDMSSSDMNYDITIDGCTWRTLLTLSNNDGVKVTNGTCIDPYTKAKNLVSGFYAWDAVGGVGTNVVYQVKNRGTGGDPSISSPTGVLVRDRVTIASADLLTIGATDGWYYGNTEVQTIAISGSPTGGSWTASFNGAGPTATIALAATAATVQTTLRTLTGLSAVTVTSSGTGNNLTYTVAMTGFSGDPPQMTSANTFTGGTSPTITHATPNPYPGYNTLAVGIGDSNRYDPDNNPIGAVQTVTLGQGEIGILLQNTLTDVVFDNILLKTTYNNNTSLVASIGASPLTMTDVKFNHVMTKSGSLSGAFRMWDFGSSANGVRRNVEFNDCVWTMNNRKNEVRVPVRLPMTYGGNVTFNRCKAPFIGSTCDFTGSKGNVKMIDCEWGTNEFIVTVDATTNEVTLQSDQLLGWGLSNIIHTTGMAVRFFPTDATATSGLTHGQIYFLRSENASTVHLTSANAVSDASPVDLTTSTPLRMEVLDMNNALMLTDTVPTGAVLADHVFYSGDSRGNKIHGAKARTMAQLVANADDYKLPLCDWIRCSSDASRNITGFDRDFTGTVGVPVLDAAGGEREFLFTNVGAQNIVIKNADAGVNSQTENQILTSTAADITLAANQSVRVFEDRIARCWRTIGA